MAYNLIIKPQAENDIDNALEWYSGQNEHLPLKLLNELEQSLEKKIILNIIKKDIMRLELFSQKNSHMEFTIQ